MRFPIADMGGDENAALALSDDLARNGFIGDVNAGFADGFQVRVFANDAAEIIPHGGDDDAFLSDIHAWKNDF